MTTTPVLPPRPADTRTDPTTCSLCGLGRTRVPGGAWICVHCDELCTVKACPLCAKFLPPTEEV
jgi:hypothetical protein